MVGSHWLWDVFRSTGKIHAYLLYKRYMQVREPQTSPDNTAPMDTQNAVTPFGNAGGGLSSM